LLNSVLNVLQTSEGTLASRRDRSVVRVVMLDCRHGFKDLFAIHLRELYPEVLKARGGAELGYLILD